MRAPRWWDEHVLPRLVDRTMSGLRAATCGRDAVRGLVVEVGFGSGRNLAHYGPDVTGVLAVEPADLAWERALPRIAAFGRPVERVGTDAAGLDLSTASVDAVVSTWTLCTIPALVTALPRQWSNPCGAPGRRLPPRPGHPRGTRAGSIRPHQPRAKGMVRVGERPPHGTQRTQHTHRDLTTCFIPPGV